MSTPDTSAPDITAPEIIAPETTTTPPKPTTDASETTTVPSESTTMPSETATMSPGTTIPESVAFSIPISRIATKSRKKSDAKKESESKKEECELDDWCFVYLYKNKPDSHQAVKCDYCFKWTWDQSDMDDHSENHPSLIIPQLYLGNRDNAEDLEILHQISTTHILNVAEDCEPMFENKFEYLHLILEDHPTQDIRPYFEHSFAFIDDALKSKESSVYVHCVAGISRSSSFVIAYLMRSKNWSLSKALNFVKKQRSCIKPNYGFIEELMTYDVDLHGKTDYKRKSKRLFGFRRHKNIHESELPADLSSTADSFKNTFMENS